MQPLKTASSNQTEGRRRSFRERVGRVGVIRLLCSDETTLDQVQVSDVSLHGARLVSRRQLPIGTHWNLELNVGPLHLSSRLRIVRCQSREDGTYDVGGEFC